jgi:ketosteroid isomerase-like protein
MKPAMNAARFAGLLALLLAEPALGADRISELEQVVAAERAFAARAQQVNARRAFAEYFAPDAVLFTPFAAPAFPGLNEDPDWAVNIQWRPVAAAISGAGDMGYTTGPSEYRRSPGEPPVGFGHYTSVWQRQGDGRFLVRVDIGIEHSEPLREADWNPSGGPAARVAELPAAHRDAALKELREFDAHLGAMGPERSQALSGVLPEDARLHYSKQLPVVGRRAILEAVRTSTGSFDWQPEGAGIAASADFGYVYGRGRLREADGTSGDLAYLNIWQRRDSAWRLLVQVVRPIRPRPTTQ